MIPSKFFMYEMCCLYELFIWFNQLSPFFPWVDVCDFFNPLIINFLYFETDLLELNPLFDIHKVRAEDIKGELSFFTRIKIPDFNLHDLEENTDFIVKLKFIIEILQQLDKAEDKDNFFQEKQPSLSFFLPINTSYIDIFPHDNDNQQWLLGRYLFKNKEKFILNIDSAFPQLIKFDYFDRLILMHVIWSFINRFIDSEIKNFLFFYIYVYFPKFYYFPEFFWENIIIWYKLSKNLMKNTNFFWKFFKFKKKRLPELEKIFNKFFLYPEELDKWLPFLDFRLTVVYIPQPFLDKHYLQQIIVSTNLLFCNLFNWRWTWHKYKIFDTDISFELIENLNPIINVFITTKDFINFNNKFFFDWNNSYTSAKILYKLQLIGLYLPAFLSLRKKKQNFLFLLDDNLFFFFTFWEFNIYNWYKKKLKKKKGRPRKKQLFYFESEKNWFENKKQLSRVSITNNWFLSKKLLIFFPKNQFFIIKFIFRQLLINPKKPF